MYDSLYAVFRNSPVFPLHPYLPILQLCIVSSFLLTYCNEYAVPYQLLELGSGEKQFLGVLSKEQIYKTIHIILFDGIAKKIPYIEGWR